MGLQVDLQRVGSRHLGLSDAEDRRSRLGLPLATRRGVDMDAFPRFRSRQGGVNADYHGNDQPLQHFQTSSVLLLAMGLACLGASLGVRRIPMMSSTRLSLAHSLTVCRQCPARAPERATQHGA